MANIAQQMGPKSKKDAKHWRKQEKKKLEVIEHAFNTEVALEEAIEIRQRLDKNES
jgi:hypothetical protein